MSELIGMQVSHRKALAIAGAGGLLTLSGILTSALALVNGGPTAATDFLRSEMGVTLGARHWGRDMMRCPLL